MQPLTWLTGIQEKGIDKALEGSLTMLNQWMTLLMFLAHGPLPVNGQEALTKLGQHLTGSWYSEDGRVEEHWTTAVDGLILGLNRNASGKGIPFFEFLRIERRADGVFYVAQPKGTMGAAFKLVVLDDEKAVFENSHHDFPQVITYRWQGGDRICAAIGSLKERERISWCWQRGPFPRKEAPEGKAP